VRIAGQLIDASTGATLWADRFEGQLKDIFDLQDQVTASVVGAIAPKLEQAEIERARHKPTESLDAYDYFLRGMACVHRWNAEANAEALQHFVKAIHLDSGFAAAYGMAARCYAQRKGSGWTVDGPKEAAEAERLAKQAAALGRDDAVALSATGMALAFVVGDLDRGAALIARALVLNPNSASGWLFSAWVKVWLGEPEIAIEASRTARVDAQVVLGCHPGLARLVHHELHRMLVDLMVEGFDIVSGGWHAESHGCEIVREVESFLDREFQFHP
jgi:tetratricopeptide (TPR) repeat protein